MGPISEAVVEKTVEMVKDVASRFELPDDSGERKYFSELPDDSGRSQLEHLLITDVPKAEGSSKELSPTEKQVIKAETGWSDGIIDSIENMDQYKIYKDADLHEGVINDRKCLIKEIDMDYVDSKTEMTNRERMERGLSPIDAKTGEKIELHHMGQKFDSPFAELTENSEHGNGNHKTLHTSTAESWRNDPEKSKEYQQEKKDHWKQRVTNVVQEG